MESCAGHHIHLSARVFLILLVLLLVQGASTTNDPGDPVEAPLKPQFADDGQLSVLATTGFLMLGPTHASQPADVTVDDLQHDVIVLPPYAKYRKPSCPDLIAIPQSRPFHIESKAIVITLQGHTFLLPPGTTVRISRDPLIFIPINCIQRIRIINSKDKAKVTDHCDSDYKRQVKIFKSRGNQVEHSRVYKARCYKANLWHVDDTFVEVIITTSRRRPSRLSGPPRRTPKAISSTRS